MLQKFSGMGDDAMGGMGDDAMGDDFDDSDDEGKYATQFVVG